MSMKLYYSSKYQRQKDTDVKSIDDARAFVAQCPSIIEAYVYTDDKKLKWIKRGGKTS